MIYKLAAIYVIWMLATFASCAPVNADTTSARNFSGLVVSVLDGDTIEVLHNQRPERVRLRGIDCPEKGQGFGSRAKQAASQLAFGKEVTLQTHGHDKYGRTLAEILLPDGMNLNQELVKQGLVLVVSEVCAGGCGTGRTRKVSTIGEKGLALISLS